MEEAQDRFNLIAWQVLADIGIKEQFFSKKKGYTAEDDRWFSENVVIPFQGYIKFFIEGFNIDPEQIDATSPKQDVRMRKDFYRCFKPHVSLDKSGELNIDQDKVQAAIEKFCSPSASAKLGSSEDDKSKWGKHHVKEKFQTLFHEVKDATLEDHTVKTTDLSEGNLEKFVQQAIALRKELLDAGLIKDEPVVINAPTPEKLEELQKICNKCGLVVKGHKGKEELDGAEDKPASKSPSLTRKSSDKG